jgi:hypothetical protein
MKFCQTFRGEVRVKVIERKRGWIGTFGGKFPMTLDKYNQEGGEGQQGEVPRNVFVEPD